MEQREHGQLYAQLGHCDGAGAGDTAGGGAAVRILPEPVSLPRARFLNTCFMAGLFINVNYIVVPIFLMLKDGDAWLKNLGLDGLLLNNLFVLALVYASTALPFTVYLLSGVLRHPAPRL